MKEERRAENKNGKADANRECKKRLKGIQIS
jgi:hypothetical protein